MLGKNWKIHKKFEKRSIIDSLTQIVNGDDGRQTDG